MKKLFIAIIFPFVLLGCGENAKIAYKVIDEKGNPLKGVKIMAGYMTGGSWSGDIPYKYHGKEGITDTNGIYVYKSRIKYGVTASAMAEGYYKTSAEEVFAYELRKSIRNYVSNPIVITLKQKIEPIQMYAKKVNAELPQNINLIGYDLVKGDFVAPFGSGTIKDFVFHIDSGVIKNVTFTNKQDGIQPFFVRNQYQPAYKIHHYELKSSQRAPKSGYSTSLNEADSNWKNLYKNEEYRKVERRWEEEVNYYFKIRSSNNGKALYGKIYGYLQLDNIPKSKPSRIQFTYYLNPTGTNNVEFAPGKSLFTSSSSIGAENPPNEP